MKKLLLSSAALVALTAGAVAADLPRRSAPAPAFVAAPVFTWTGFYVGANLGWAWNQNDDDVITVPAGTFAGAPATAGTFVVTNGDDDGITGGAQAGYNMQFGQFVVGVEADIQAIDFGNGGTIGTFTTTAGPGLPVGFVTTTSRIGSGLDWWGTVRGRAGFAFDRALIYATGGFAFGGGDSNGIDDDDTDTGYTLGGGVEYAITNNLTVGVEGLYVNLDRDSSRVAIGTVGATTVLVPVGDELEFGVARAKINWKF